MMTMAARLSAKSTIARSMANRAREKENADSRNQKVRRKNCNDQAIPRIPASIEQSNKTISPHDQHHGEQCGGESQHGAYLKHQSTQTPLSVRRKLVRILGPRKFWIPSNAGLPADTTPRHAANTPAAAAPWKNASSHG